MKSNITNNILTPLIVIILSCFSNIACSQIDNTTLLQKKIDKCFEEGKNCILESKIYYVKKLNIKGSIQGQNGTIIKRITKNNNNDKYNFCRIEDESDVLLRNLTIDGGSGSILDKNGAVPLSIVRSKNITVDECTFLNSYGAGLRISQSNIITIKNSKSYNNYGEFGDGFYVEHSSNIAFVSVVASNYNRIGFVLDRNVENVKFEGCKASDGTNASILRGGKEYNAGFWFEKAGGVSLFNCVAFNNTHYGFVAVSGLDNHNERVSFSFNNCISYKNKVGFKSGSLGKNAVKVDFKDCKTYSVNSAFEITCKNPMDYYYINGCEIGYNVTNNYSIGIHFNSNFHSSGKANLNVSNSKFVYPKSFSSRFLKSASSYNSDFFIADFEKVNVITKSNLNSNNTPLTVKSPTMDISRKSSLGGNHSFIKSSISK